MQVRGAVLSEAPQEAVITSTVATRHYGVTAFSVWQDDDEGQVKSWDEYRERYRVEKMTWYIHTVRQLLTTSLSAAYKNLTGRGPTARTEHILSILPYCRGELCGGRSDIQGRAYSIRGNQASEVPGFR